MADVKITPVAPTVGAAVSGVDVRTMDADAFGVIRQAFVDHRMLVIEGQDLDPGELMAFGERWGTLLVHPLTPTMPGFPPVQELTNSGKRRTLNEHWHTDMSFEPVPPKMTILHAKQVPELGGDTAFADQHAAYESLTPGLRATLEGLRAVHHAERLALIMGNDPSASPRAVHPVVRTHPETGRKALYVCRAFTQKIEGWSREESAGLLSFLFERSARPDLTMRHRWRAGDLVLWDNRSLLHYAIHDHAEQPRVLHRVTVQGEVPA